MKPQFLILSGATIALMVATGCQSGSHPASMSSPGGPEAGKTAAAATVSSPATQVAAPPVATQPRASTVRIKAGAGAMKDSAGNEWLGEVGFEGGDVIERPDLQIANTRLPEIYRSERYSMDSFSCKVPNGRYQVKLHFCETFDGISGPGERVFSFDVEGRTYKDFDVWAKAGGFAKAYVETVDVNIADGKLDIKFTPNIENPQINGIEIIPLL